MQKDIIERKKAEVQGVIAGAMRELAGLEAQEQEASKRVGIAQWIGNSFESSSGLTKEFSNFAADYRRELVGMLGKGYNLIQWNRGHFYLSGFIKNVKTGKLAYFSTSDVRGSNDSWYSNILVRTAQHEKDYSGGRNEFTTWTKLQKAVASLTQ